MPFEQLARCQAPILLQQDWRLQKMIGVILTESLCEPFQENRDPVFAPFR